MDHLMLLARERQQKLLRETEQARLLRQMRREYRGSVSRVMTWLAVRMIAAGQRLVRRYGDAPAWEIEAALRRQNQWTSLP